ncbi:sugar ABC transporter ATP-binding protein [Aggregatilinea lenta]|uniref:sugar ABC transporter ATP-binding protein n=1 Tax=Aggregatilinea lenta TaxID=913108 RepID=UPI000E5A2AC0|nr:sugar ABC transporter ATP-binding protein [Aggregatilinea lenta]
MEKEPVLRVESVSKRFPGVHALKEVDFEVYPGEVVALLGENGAGKSTLMKILAGAYHKDSGRIFLRENEINPHDTAESQALGIATIYQEFTLTPNQTAAANIFMSREPRYGGVLKPFHLINRKRMERDAIAMLDTVGAHVPPGALVEKLSVAARQQVEIAKALAVDAQVIIMDEPTSALGKDETRYLFQIVRSLRERGLSIIFITHRLEEVFEIADRVVVLRDGERVGTLTIQDATIDKIIHLMVGRELGDLYQKETVERGDVVLKADGLTRRGAVEDVSFELRRGEILGFAGLVGAGRTETMRLIFGADHKDAGTIWLDGKPVRVDSPQRAVELGIGLIPEDRGNQGLVLELSVLFNMILPNLNRFARASYFKAKPARHTATDFVNRLRVRTPGLYQSAKNLSGGNQQKVVLAKWLMANPRVLIMDEPTRGIDVGAKSEIHGLMSDLARQGIGIIMISSEMPEILAMSDRIIVMHEGRISGVLDRAEATQERIMAYASGQGALAESDAKKAEVVA